MGEKEIMQWAIKGINAEITKMEKKLKRALLIQQAHRKGIQKNANPEKVEERITSMRAEIELLLRKKAFLIVQIENN